MEQTQANEHKCDTLPTYRLTTLRTLNCFPPDYISTLVPIYLPSQLLIYLIHESSTYLKAAFATNLKSTFKLAQSLSNTRKLPHLSSSSALNRLRLHLREVMVVGHDVRYDRFLVRIFYANV